MAGDWIKVREDIAEDPAVIAIGRALSAPDDDLIVGKLIRVWTWAQKHTENGRIDGATAHHVDTIARMTGFAEAMENAHWLTLGSDFVEFPRFDRHMSDGAKSRAMANLRQSRKRAKLSRSCHGDVTDMSRTQRDKNVTREEKRREEKSTHDDTTEKRLLVDAKPVVVVGVGALKDAKSEAALIEFGIDGHKASEIASLPHGKAEIVCGLLSHAKRHRLGTGWVIATMADPERATAIATSRMTLRDAAKATDRAAKDHAAEYVATEIAESERGEVCRAVRDRLSLPADPTWAEILSTPRLLTAAESAHRLAMNRRILGDKAKSNGTATASPRPPPAR